LRPKVF